MPLLSILVSFPDNPGYLLNQEGYIVRKPEHDWQRGWYQPTTYEPRGDSLEVVQRHSRIGQVIATTDFMPSFLPIWGNQVTFSFEPYFERALAQGEEASWSIAYKF